jgi:prepilin peptidase CpaA
VTAQICIAAVVGVAAIIDDLSRRKISNWIPSSAFVAGVVLQTIQGGWRGAGAALLGALTGGGVFLIFYLLGGMGGGDIKLMAGFGAVLGVKRLLEAALWTAGCGGVMALVVIGCGSVAELLRARGILKARGVVKDISAEKETLGDSGIRSVKRTDSIPYAPAIAAGVWLSLVPKT